MGKLELLMKFLDLFLHILDIYSDIEVTVTLFLNCDPLIYKFSLAIFALSYITTVLALRFVTHRKESWKDALLYPYHTVRIILRKIIIIILSMYIQCFKLSPSKAEKFYSRFPTKALLIGSRVNFDLQQKIKMGSDVPYFSLQPDQVSQ